MAGYGSASDLVNEATGGGYGSASALVDDALTSPAQKEAFQKGDDTYVARNTKYSGPLGALNQAIDPSALIAGVPFAQDVGAAAYAVKHGLGNVLSGNAPDFGGEFENGKAFQRGIEAARNQ